MYLHSGESYVVTWLDLEEHVAYVEQSDVNYYTTPGSKTWAKVEEQIDSKKLAMIAQGIPALGVEVRFGDVSVGNQVTHFWRKRLFTDESIERVPLDLPETHLRTEAVWLVLPREMTDKLIGRGLDLLGTIHAIEHASIGILPLIALCDRNDIGGVSHPSHSDTDGLAAIFIYDGHAGGVGISRAAYDSIEELLEATLRTIEDCPCEEGCPSCVQSPKCGNNNEPLDKAGAAYLLREMLRFDTAPAV